MNGLDMRRYEMLVRVREFGKTHSEIFPPGTVGGQAFAEVTTAIESLNAHAAEYASGRGSARETVTTKAIARGALREDIDAIVRTARAMSLGTPGLEDKFRPPRGSGDLALINTARAFVRDAAPMSNEFLAYSMPEDFLEDLNRDIRAFEDAMRGRDAGTGVHVAARAALDKTMEAALNALKRLDAAVPNRLKGDAAALAVWTRARRLAPATRRGESVEAEPEALPVAAASIPDEALAST